MHIFAGQFKKRSLKTPKGTNTRPTTGIVRQAVFNIIQHEIEGMVFLDLFAGSGAMGLEALSRGAKYSLFVENDRKALKCIEENIRHLDVETQTEIFGFDVLRALHNLGKAKKTFDCIYADPPYLKPHEEVLLSERVVQNIGEYSLLKKGGVLFIEEDRDALLEEGEYRGLKFIEKRPFGKSILYIFRPEH